ncbi:MAG: hypothetical protein KJZ74_14815 [Gemmatimonadales bacterium]|nr:hypothetical protein [Gemmatimonadales bacterium]
MRSPLVVTAALLLALAGTAQEGQAHAGRADRAVRPCAEGTRCDRVEDRRDRREDVRDRREDVRDARHDGGRRDRIEDRWDRREDVRDRREDRRERRRETRTGR